MEEQFITEDMLTDLGIDLAGEDKVAVLAQLNDTLQERIGVEISQLLDETELEELQELQESSSDEIVDEWLEKHVPNLEDIVSNNVVALLDEMTKDADTDNR